MNAFFINNNDKLFFPNFQLFRGSVEICFSRLI